MEREDIIAQYNLGDEKGNLNAREEEFVQKILDENVDKPNFTEEQIKITVDKMFDDLEEKYIEDAQGEEKRWPHEMIFDGCENNQEYIRMFLDMKVNFMMQFETMEIFVTMTALKMSIMQSKQLLLDAKMNGFNLDPTSKRIVVDSIRRMEHVYNEFNNVMYGAKDELDNYEEGEKNDS